MADQKGTVATAYVQLIPSADGAQQNIENALVPGAEQAGMHAGKKSGESATKSFGASIQSAGGKLSKIGGKLSTAITAPIVGAGTAAIASWHEIDEAVDTVTQKTGASGAALTDMQNRAKEIAKTIPVSFQNAGDAIGEVNTRFGLTGDTLQGLSQQFVEFAKLNNADVSSSVDNVQTAMDAFGVSVNDAGAVLDLFNSVGQSSGISMDALESELTSNATAFQSLGMDIDDSAQLLGKLEKSGVDASTVMTGLSRVQMNAAKDGKSMSDELQAALSSQTSAIDIFGARSGAKLYEAFHNGTLSVDDFTGKAGGLDETLGNVSTTFNNTLDPADKFTVNMNKLKDAAGGLVDSSAPMITDVMGKMSDTIDKASQAWNSLDSGQQQTIIKLAGVAAAVGPVLAIGGKAISGFGKLVGGITKAGGAIGGIIGKITGLGGAASVASAPVQAAGTATGALSQNALGLVAAGAGILLASAGLFLLAQAAVQIGQAGAPAAIAMASMVGVMALMAVGAAALAPALTAGAVGLVAFGAGVALVGVGSLAAAAGISMLAVHLPTIAAYGVTSSVAILQLSGSLVAFSGSSIAAGACALTLGAGLIVAGAGATVSGVGMVILGASLALVKTEMSSIAKNASQASSSLAKMQSSVNVVKTGVSALKSNISDLGSKISGAFKQGSTSSVASARSMASGINASFSSIKAGSHSMASAFNSIPAGAARSMAQTRAIVASSLRFLQSMVGSVRFQFNESMKLPHFSMSGNFNAQTKQVPSVSVKWYAKGGILNRPMIFGMQDGNLLGGGEAGPEAVLPIDNLKTYIKDAMGEEKQSRESYTQNIYVSSPKALTPSEIARQTRNATRQMALKMTGA